MLSAWNYCTKVPYPISSCYCTHRGSGNLLQNITHKLSEEKKKVSITLHRNRERKMACVAVASLVRTIELEFLQYQPRPVVLENNLISSNKELIQSFHKKLGFLIKQLDERRIDGVEAIKHLETKLRDLALRVEDEIEFQVAHLYDRDVDEEEDELRVADLYVEKPQRDTDAEKTQPCLKLRQILQCAMEEIDAIEEELVKIKNRDELEGRKTALDVLPSSEVDSSQHASHSEDKMVGKNDEFEIIKKLLTEHGSKEKKVVSIIGMGGIGKTTLARRVYEDPSIAIHFDVRAWVVASQLHNKRQMLVGLLNSISKLGNLESSTDEDLALKLYQSLKRQRCMVVIDDVWSGEAWDDVSKCFPDDGNGSRVLLTTRLAEVANYTSSDNDFAHQMQLLDKSESWNLFCEKACKSRGAEFEKIGRPIVEKCKGLPLAIVVAASLFSKLNTLCERKNMAETLKLFGMTTIVEVCSRIFSLSYNHLPHKLKACFLYLGIFPKDKVIYVKDLVRLWAVEGLIKESENVSLDEVAERYICELSDRNLILVSKLSYCGRKIKAFQMHDLLHAFCVREAQKENLLHVVTENGSSSPLKGFRWLSIQSADFDTRALYSSSIKCRSIFCFLEVKSLCLKIFNLLRVFYFTDASMCKKIVDLVHLRYLPPVVRHFRTLKLFRAWNLQTLSVYAGDGRNYLKFPQQQDSHGPPKLVLKPYHCTIEFFRKNPYLKEVRITGERRECNDCIENLVYLPQLEGLYINDNVLDYRTLHMISINNQIAHLKRLKVLSFRSMNFEWKGINVLCKLPRLEVLKFNGACVGKEWELPEDDKFSQLIFLQFGSPDLKDWKATGDHFPKLEHLVLYECEVLEDIPSGFADISTLKSIKLMGCLPSVATSAKEIKEEQLDYLNNIVDVIVTEGRRGYFRDSQLESDEYESDEL